MKKTFNNQVSKEFLLNIPVPQDTRTYKAFENKAIIESTLEGIERSGFTLKKEMYYSNTKGSQCLGRYGIELTDSKIGVQIAFHNSYDKVLSLKYGVGEFLFICSNGAITGSDGAFKSKHAGDIQLITPIKMEEFINNSAYRFEDILKHKKRFEEIEITKKTCAELTGRMFIEEEIINSTQLSIIKKEIDNPSFNYDVDNTLWNFWNHCTYAMQETHPKDYIDKSLKMYNFFEEVFA